MTNVQWYQIELLAQGDLIAMIHYQQLKLQHNNKKKKLSCYIVFVGAEEVLVVWMIFFAIQMTNVQWFQIELLAQDDLLAKLINNNKISKINFLFLTSNKVNHNCTVFVLVMVCAVMMPHFVMVLIVQCNPKEWVAKDNLFALQIIHPTDPPTLCAFVMVPAVQIVLFVMTEEGVQCL